MTNNGEIRALTGLRGEAACFVMVYHYTSGGIGFGPLAGVVQRGYQAVDLFFVLSGYVRAMTYAVRLKSQLTASRYLESVVRRIARVYPLFIAVTVIVLLAWPPASGATGLTFITDALLIQSWGLADSIGGPTWSISTEFAAYLIFPVVCYSAVWGSSAGSLATAVVKVCIIAFVTGQPASSLHQLESERFGPLDVYQGTSLFPLLRCLDGFTLGAAAYRLARIAPIHRIARLPALADAATALIAVLLTIPQTDIILPLCFVALIVLLVGGAVALRRSAVFQGCSLAGPGLILDLYCPSPLGASIAESTSYNAWRVAYPTWFFGLGSNFDHPNACHCRDRP